ncbi:MAG: hypothetical protein ACLU99_11245 [Alphaproteobacteria bacterium]
MSEEIEKFNAAGGAFILVNLKNNEVLNSASISILESFDYNRDYSYTPQQCYETAEKGKISYHTAVY